MKANLFAFTALGSAYPPYVSINKLEDGRVEITVRSEPRDGREGSTAAIALDAATFESLTASFIGRT